MVEAHMNDICFVTTENPMPACFQFPEMNVAIRMGGTDGQQLAIRMPVHAAPRCEPGLENLAGFHIEHADLCRRRTAHSEFPAIRVKRQSFRALHGRPRFGSPCFPGQVVNLDVTCLPANGQPATIAAERYPCGILDGALQKSLPACQFPDRQLIGKVPTASMVFRSQESTVGTEVRNPRPQPPAPAGEESPGDP